MALSSGSSGVQDSRESFPTYDLTYRYDNASNPTELTVFPAAETKERTTAWLTIDEDHAVPLETTR